MSQADISSKQTIHLYSQAWLEWLFQPQSFEIEAQLSGEFQFIARATDSLLQVKRSTERFLALTELQLYYDDNMPARLMAYAALARQKYHQEVFVTVVYFLPPSAGVTIPHHCHRECFGQIAHQDFQVIALWELEAEQVLNFNNPVLFPFIPLMQGGNTEPLLRRCVERIRQEPLAAELESILAVFASYVVDTRLITNLLRWEMPIVKESPLIQELLAQEREKTQLEDLYEILTIRFHVNLNHFGQRFEHLGSTALKQLHKAALTSSSLAEFEAILANFSTEKP